MDSGFLNRIVRTSLVTGLGLAVVVAFYFGVPAGVAFGISSAWAALGLKLLQLFLVSASRPEGGGALTTFFLGVLKFPVLYGTGVALLLIFKPNGVAVFAGLTLVLMVMVLQHLGRALMDSEWFSRPVAGESRKQ